MEKQQEIVMELETMLDWMRCNGWAVAVHNDYKVGGEKYTFWLFTHPNGTWVKGEAPTDREAVSKAMGCAEGQHE